MNTNTRENPRHDRAKNIATLLQTIGRAAVAGHGIPTFNELIDTEAADETSSLIMADLGDLSKEVIEDLKHDAISYATAGNVREAEAALNRLENAFGNRQTNHCEAYYLIGVAVTLRAVAQARALANLDITNVLTALVNREEGGER